jgi:hypothetical protein
MRCIKCKRLLTFPEWFSENCTDGEGHQCLPQGPFQIRIPSIGAEA